MTGAQMRAARALLRWEQRHLAMEAGVRPATISQMEQVDSDVPGRHVTVEKVRRAFERAGIEFFDNHGVAFRAHQPDRPSSHSHEGLII